MHRDALTDLGESLRGEFQALFKNDEAVLADLVGDAQRLLETLDHQLQTLAAWLTSPSVSADLAFDASPAPEEVAPAAQMSLPTDWQRASSAHAAHRPEADFSAPSTRDAPADVTDTREGLPSSNQTSAVDGTRNTTASSSLTAVPLSASHAHQASDGTEPTRGAAPPPYPGLYDLDPHIQKVLRLDTSPLTAASPRGESNAPRLAAAQREQAVRVDAPTPGQRSESTAPMETPGGRRDRIEFAPPEAGLPPPTAMGRFTSVKNLHDLARLLSVGDWDTSSPLESPITPKSDGAESDAAGRTPSTEERVSAPVDVWRTPMFPGQDDVPLLLVQSQQQAPAQPPSAARGNGVRQETLPGGKDAGEQTATPPQEDVLEVDVDSLLDALSRSVAEEYKRFYGS